MAKNVKVIKENDNGRNIRFKDQKTKGEMSRSEFVSEIKRGKYDEYYTRKINGIETPVSKPDKSKKNNLG